MHCSIAISYCKWSKSLTRCWNKVLKWPEVHFLFFISDISELITCKAESRSAQRFVKDLFLVKVHQFYRRSFMAYHERILDFWNLAYHGSYDMNHIISYGPRFIITNDSLSPRFIGPGSIITNDSLPLNQGSLDDQALLATCNRDCHGMFRFRTRDGCVAIFISRYA